MFPLAEIFPEVFPLVGESSLLSIRLIAHVCSRSDKSKLTVERHLTLLVGLSLRDGQSRVEGKCSRDNTDAQQESPDPF